MTRSGVTEYFVREQHWAAYSTYKELADKLVGLELGASQLKVNIEWAKNAGRLDLAAKGEEDLNEWAHEILNLEAEVARALKQYCLLCCSECTAKLADHGVDFTKTTHEDYYNTIEQYSAECETAVKTLTDGVLNGDIELPLPKLNKGYPPCVTWNVRRVEIEEPISPTV